MSEQDAAAIRREDGELHAEMRTLETNLSKWRAFGEKLVELGQQGQLRYGVWQAFMDKCPKAASDIRQKVRSAFTGPRKKNEHMAPFRKKPNERKKIPDSQYKDH